MNNNTEPIELLFQKVEEYGKSTLDVLKLQAIEKSADVLSSLMGRLALLVTAALSVLLANIGLAFLIGNWLGNDFYGFFIVAGFYALLAVLLKLFGNVWIEVPLKNSIIAQLWK